MKNIVICCDGTGNEFRARENTNVVLLYRALKKEDPTKQIAYYDPGLGTESAQGVLTPPLKFLTKLSGLVFGYGLSKNMIDAYQFLMNRYEPGDRVFLFGFSRGAYTVRALAGMLKMVGLLEKDTNNLVYFALKVYRQQKPRRPKWAHGVWAWVYYVFIFLWKKEPDWARAGGFKKTFCRPCPIHFIGVWDTVKSIGWFRRRIVLPYTFYNPDIKNGCHAVSIDEKRSQYRPNLWGYPNSDNFKEVWFTGVHSDIGGSYEETGLSDLTLKWMLDESKRHNLLIDEKRYELIEPDPNGTIHNPLLPFWWTLGWKKRKILKIDRKKDAAVNTPESWIHKSVDIRTRQKNNRDKSRLSIPDHVLYVD